MQEPKHANVLRFGVFDVDLRSGELRKSGSKISLQEQPFKILTALLEHPGEVVTREELRSLIWPQESFGDFDHAVCVAVAKLRTALGDSADVPRYVETLHRRGYRFIFPLVGASGSETRARPRTRTSATTRYANRRRTLQRLTRRPRRGKRSRPCTRIGSENGKNKVDRPPF